MDIDDHAITLQKMKETGVDEGSLVYALGFPMNLMNDSVKTPICRLGCISRISDAFVSPHTSETFLVDAQTFPENSFLFKEQPRIEMQTSSVLLALIYHIEILSLANKLTSLL